MIIRRATSSDLPPAIIIARDTFQSAVAPLYEAEGIKTFLEFATLDATRQRMEQDYATYVAIDNGSVIGMAHVRDRSHLSMLFVAEANQRKGIGRALLERVIKDCDADAISVHSSPNAEAAYLRFGFRPTNEKQLDNGILYIPMALKLRK